MRDTREGGWEGGPTLSTAKHDERKKVHQAEADDVAEGGR